MLKNYFIASIRNLARYKSYSFINIFGLSVGLATTLFIFLWVMDEMSYDQFHAKSDRLYKVMINNTRPDGTIETYSATPSLLKEVIKTEVPEAEQLVHLSMETEHLIKLGQVSSIESGLYADANLFSILSFPVVKR